MPITTPKSQHFSPAHCWSESLHCRASEHSQSGERKFGCMGFFWGFIIEFANVSSTVSKFYNIPPDHRLQGSIVLSSGIPALICFFYHLFSASGYSWLWCIDKGLSCKEIVILLKILDREPIKWGPEEAQAPVGSWQATHGAPSPPESEHDSYEPEWKTCSTMRTVLG